MLRRRLFLSITVVLLVVFAASLSFGEDAWITEFGDICGRTQEAGGMTKADLRDMVQRAEKLQTVIEKSEHPDKAMYLRRLDRCKRLFQFVLDSSEK